MGIGNGPWPARVAGKAHRAEAPRCRRRQFEVTTLRSIPIIHAVIMSFQKMLGEWTRNATLSRDARLDFQEIAVSRDLRMDA